MTTEQASAGRLTTHVLDTAAGRPGAGIDVELYCLDEGSRECVATARTNSDGRCDQPLLSGDSMRAGTYELVFHVGAYFSAQGVNGPTPRFLDIVPVRFGLASPDQHYHVPLLISPFAYSTYRGS